jgi:hypothetical protein
MLVSSSAWYYELLACPDCTQDVALSDGVLRCLSCGYSAPLGDLRSHDPQPFVTTDALAARAAAFDAVLVPTSPIWRSGV